MLQWAREEAGYSVEAAAERAKVAPERLAAWESGEARLTLRQAEELAAIYHRSYSVFCLSTPPVSEPVAGECRRLPGVTPGEESPELRFALRQMLDLRRTALWLADELGEPTDSFGVRIQLSENAETVGARLRTALGVSVSSQVSWRDEFQAWRGWRASVERIGVFVFQFSKVSPEEVRGVCILDFPAPVIGVNIKEIAASKPFTLLHELVHLALANAREESAAIEERRTDSEWREVERFAEEVTAAVLLPKPALLAEPTISDHSAGAPWSLTDIRDLARRYRVTPLAMVTRLLRIGKCDPASYKKWKNAWNEYLELHPPKPAMGIATPAQKAVNRNGQPFTRLVLEALTRERITSLDAARFLNLRYPHIEILRRDITSGLPSFFREETGAR